MTQNPVHYVPIFTTVVATAFSIVLYRHWRRHPQARYLFWWMIGVFLYGVGTFTEAITTLTGWHGIVFRAWYISGALLGGAPLAQGTVYLLLKKKTADRLTIALVSFVAAASALVLATPLDPSKGEANSLTGKVIVWWWIRLLTPFVNLYAVAFLVGGAIWSAVRYKRSGDAPSRVIGNWLIAIGAILPGFGGSFAKAGYVEVLYATEFVGLLAIWAGYRMIVGDRVISIHRVQRETMAEASRSGSAD
ncbi:MAG: hypothetical protein WBV06_06690 [Acidimicrobiia bacterium]